MKRFGFLFLFSISLLLLQSQTIRGFQGVTKEAPKKQLITPSSIEVTFDKTVHIIFPAKVIYVDLGSNQIIASKAHGAENVIRVKAATEDYPGETNLSVICDDGGFYSFNARYANEPQMLNIEMQSSSNIYQQPSTTVYLTELGYESPKDVNMIMNNIYKRDKKHLRHLGSKQQETEFTIRDIYVYNGMFYFHTMIKNRSQVAFDIDYIKFKIVDKQLSKRSPTQEKALEPVRIYPATNRIKGKSSVRIVYALPKFTITKDQLLAVELVEKNGGRHQSIQVENRDITRAKTIDKFKIK